MKRNALPFDVSLSLPDWVHNMEPELLSVYPSDEDKMDLAIELARRNVLAKTGGPFGAAIFSAEDGSVVSVGVNRVVPLTNSTAHAEMLAFMLAQQALAKHRLNANDHHFILATSAQMCAMCYGASVWAGIDRILIGARREDVESLTAFDEGPMPRNWIVGLRSRGIHVTRDLRRRKAREVLNLYTETSGTTY